MLSRRLLYCGLLWLAAPAPAATAAERVSTGRITAAFLSFKKGTPAIRGLRLDPTRELVIEETQKADGSSEFWARLSGDFTAVEESVLMLNRQDTLAKIEPGKLSVRFSTKIPILAERTPVQLTAMRPDGKVEELSATLVARYEKSSVQNIGDLLSGWKMSASLGPSLISHVETAAPSFSAWTLTTKVVADKRIKGPWSVGLLAYVTAVPISASIESVSPTFMGFSLRGGYASGLLKSPWTLTWSLGFYYTSLFGVDGTYGFKNIHGLQPIPYPTLTKRLSSLSTLSMTPKFSPIIATFPNGLIDHYQLALGIKYDRKLKRGRSWFATIDYSRFHVTLGPNQVDSTSMSLAGGVGF